MPHVETIEITRAASEPAIAEGTRMDVEAVCAMADVHADDGAVGVTAIDKRPAAFPVTVHALGIRGEGAVRLCAGRSRILVGGFGARDSVRIFR